MQKVIIIGYVWPEPSSSAAGTHMLSMLRLYVSQGWQVEFATPAQATEHMIDLSVEGVSSRSITLNCDSFDEYIKEYKPSIVHFDRFMMEEQFGWRIDQHCPNAIKVLDTVDLQFLRGARQQAHKQNRAVESADLRSELAKREIAAILRCDVSLIISSAEMQLLKESFKLDPEILHHLPFMVDLDTLPTETLPYEDRQHFMTIGNFRHAPNWDAVLYLQSIWPQIRQKLPKAELHIYGSYPPPKASNLNNPKNGFLIKGWAEDAQAVMQSSRVCLAPLRFGAGLKGKLLDAMIMQTPSVTTSIGAEGMTLNDVNWPGAIADNIDAFVASSIELYNNKSQWISAQKNALAHLEKGFDSQKGKADYLLRLSAIQQNQKSHRLNNFTGEMLKHHTMQSTKYMSKWITVKNNNP